MNLLVSFVNGVWSDAQNTIQSGFDAQLLTTQTHTVRRSSSPSSCCVRTGTKTKTITNLINIQYIEHSITTLICIFRHYKYKSCDLIYFSFQCGTITDSRMSLNGGRFLTVQKNTKVTQSEQTKVFTFVFYLQVKIISLLQM